MTTARHELCADCWADWSAWLDPQNLRRIGRAMGHVNHLGGVKVGGSTADQQILGTTTSALGYDFTPRGIEDRSRSNAGELGRLVRESQAHIRDVCGRTHKSGEGRDVVDWMDAAVERRRVRVFGVDFL